MALRVSLIKLQISEGDHIKVTASKYPFPTVCADKQSTDWFHAISRTLKWNERERQKSFVVVEEDAPKPKRKSKHNGTSFEHKANGTRVPEDALDDEEEDEVSDEEDDKFDIDDSSPEADTSSNASGSAGITPNALAVGQEKARAQRPALPPMTKRRSKSRSLSRVPPSPPMSGVESPGRYANGQPHPPSGSPRRVGFNLPNTPSTASSSDSLISLPAQSGTRDDLRSHNTNSGRSRIPKDREIDFDAVKTPTPGASRAQAEHRAFAVWGHDESDSNASDSETGF